MKKSSNRLKTSFETNNMFREVFANHRELCVLTPDDTVRLQQALLEIMDDLDTAFRKYGLTYFLAGGSALGAVRHSGFIPWDDDMDIVMPRRDYDRLNEVLQKEYPGRYWVQDVRVSDRYDVNSAKVRKVGTVCAELFESEPEKAGVFIDIYPLENVYENPVLKKLHGWFGEFLLLVCSCVRMRKNQALILPYLTRKEQIATVRRKVRLGRLFSFLPLRVWLRITERTLSRCKNETGRFVSIPSGRKHYFGEMYTRASFFPPKEVSFGSRRYFVMNEPDEYLTKLYGDDYMTFPAESGRERHAVRKFELP